MMDKKEQFKKVKEIVTVYLPEDVPKEAISKESNLINELNINSANMVDIVLDVEDAFGIRLENSDMDQIHTIEDALNIINQKVVNKNN
ncbi:acyl carrier protein [Arenibacter aquaticus]|nr:phosphopantetheine-binding protein [Arenibacter aquaticus]